MISTVVSETVHTTGINWDGILANAAAVILIVGTISALMTKVISRSLADNTRQIVDEYFTKTLNPVLQDIKGNMAELRNTQNQHAIAIARLQGIQEGRADLVQATKLSSSEVTDPSG